MEIEEQIMANAAEQIKKLQMVRKWSARIQKLRDRKQDPLTEVDFCNKYGIHASSFNRHKNLNDDKLPSVKFFEAVENAMKVENV